MMNFWSLAEFYYYRTGSRAGVAIAMMFAIVGGIFFLLFLLKRGQNANRPGICPNCGAEYPPQARFCPKCGKSVA